MDIKNSNTNIINEDNSIFNKSAETIIGQNISIKYTGISHGPASVRPSKSFKIKSILPKTVSIKLNYKKSAK